MMGRGMPNSHNSAPLPNVIFNTPSMSAVSKRITGVGVPLMERNFWRGVEMPELITGGIRDGFAHNAQRLFRLDLVGRTGRRVCFACCPNPVDNAGLRHRPARDRRPDGAISARRRRLGGVRLVGG